MPSCGRSSWTSREDLVCRVLQSFPFPAGFTDWWLLPSCGSTSASHTLALGPCRAWAPLHKVCPEAAPPSWCTCREFSLWNCSAEHVARFLVVTTALCMGLSARAVLPQVLPCASRYFSSEVAQQAPDSVHLLEIPVLLRAREAQVLGLCKCHSRGQAEAGQLLRHFRVIHPCQGGCLTGMCM